MHLPAHYRLMIKKLLCMALPNTLDISEIQAYGHGHKTNLFMEDPGLDQCL